MVFCRMYYNTLAFYNLFGHKIPYIVYLFKIAGYPDEPTKNEQNWQLSADVVRDAAVFERGIQAYWQRTF